MCYYTFWSNEALIILQGYALSGYINHIGKSLTINSKGNAIKIIDLNGNLLILILVIGLRTKIVLKMKKFLLLLALISTYIVSIGQDSEKEEEDKRTFITITKKKDKRHHHDRIKTLSGSGHHSGGFGALSFRQSEFRDKTIVMAGFRGGWIINRSLAIGFEGHGLVPTAEYDDLYPSRRAILLGGYGGMFLEPIIFSNQLVHVTFPVSAGAGWLGFHDDWEENDVNTVNEVIEEDIFWYVEPGVAMELNVSRHFRIGLGVSKRFTEDLTFTTVSDSEFENYNYFLTLKFGRF